MRSLPLLLLGTVLLAGATAGPTPVLDTHDAVIQQVARFAVLVYDLAHHTDLSYVGVVRGEMEEAASGGAVYRLVVAAAKPGGSVEQYQCVVCGVAWGEPGSRLDTWKVRRFRKMQS